MDFEEELLKRYLKSNKYNVRIRGKKHPEIIVYYNGIKYFEYKNDKFCLNEAVFLPNNKNVKALKQDKIPLKVKEDVEKITRLNFKFIVGTKNKETLNSGRKFDIPIVSNNNDNSLIVKELEEKFKEISFPNLNVKKYKNKNYMLFLGEKEDGILEFKDVYNLLVIGYSKCPSIKFYVDLINNDMSKLIEDFENSFNILDEVMERRIDLYTKKHDTIEDYISTKNDDNTEKQYQQRLMGIINGNNKKEKVELDKKIFNDGKVFAFEMEYNMYSKEKDKKERSTSRGRIDNIFIKNETLIMVELKMGTSVIAGTNGIHKHLLDLCAVFQNNKKILEETSEIINKRNEILNKYDSTKKYLIGGSLKVNLKSKEYYIICGYDKSSNITKEMIEAEIKRVYNESILSTEILKNNQKSNLTEKSKSVIDFHNTLKKYDSNLLKLTIPQYINKLENDYGCKVKIYLANENYSKLDLYQK